VPQLPDEVIRASAAEELRRYGSGAPEDRILVRARAGEVLTLSFFQVEDYLTCPLKYKFRHLLRVPVLPHHSLVFGRILHNAIHSFLQKRMAGEKAGEEEILKDYESLWVNEGFLSREHEELRKQAGRLALVRFCRREEASGHNPAFLEKSFKWQHEQVRFIGRWDRIDILDGKAVIIDFKATEVKNQREADKRTADSLQMDLYALSFIKTQKTPLLETRLYFLESDLIGRAKKGEREMDNAWEKVKEAELGIRSVDFGARPDFHHCFYCEYKTICPSTYAY